MARTGAAIGKEPVPAPEIGFELCPSWSYRRTATLV